jgi:UDP-glucose 4-epimerase
MRYGRKSWGKGDGMIKRADEKFRGKILLITGGTGSFGNAVLKRFIDTDIAEIRVFSRDEKKQDDMRHEYKSSKVRYYIGDVRDKATVDMAMKGVDYCFHSAALKQVPSCEFFPMQAVQTNVTGTSNVAQSAIDNEIEKIIYLSTDKAVYPINAMGISKAMAEKVIRAQGRMVGENGTLLNITRYGNVMASRGSVIPLFVSQARKNEDLMVTNPDMSRFLMSLDEAVELVIFSFMEGVQCDCFVKKSPACRIIDLANAIIEIFDSKSKIRVIGTRHGEKLYETLLTREEYAVSEDKGKYFRIPLDKRLLDYDHYDGQGKKLLDNDFEYSSETTKMLNYEELKELLLSTDYIKHQLKGDTREKGLI